MINTFVNERNTSIKFNTNLMSLTFDKDLIMVDKRKKQTGFIKEKSIDNESDSSNISKNIQNLSKYITNNKIYRTNLDNRPKYNTISLLKKSNLNRIHNVNRINKGNSFNKNKSKDIKSIRENFSNNYSNNRKIKDKFPLNDNYRSYYNISSLGLRDFNEEDEKKENFYFKNDDNNFEKILKRKINTFRRNSPIKNINYKSEEIKNNNESNIINSKQPKIFKNYYSRNNKYFNTFNNSNNFKDKTDYEIKDILNLLNAKDINDSIEKIKKLLVYKNFIHQLKKLYLEDNNEKKQNEIKIKDLLFFISSHRNYKNKYENLCKAIMQENNINDFDNLKLFLNKLINNKKNNNSLVKGINRIFDGFNEVQLNKTIYRNLSQRDIRSKNNLLKKNDEYFN